MSFPSKIGYPIDMNKNAINNPVFQRLASAPASPVAGQYYVNTTDGLLYKRNEANTAWEQVGGSNVVEITHTSLTTINLSNANKDVVIRLEGDLSGTLAIGVDPNTTASPRLFVYRDGPWVTPVTIYLGVATSAVVLGSYEAVEYIYNPANISYDVTNIFTLPVTGAINDDLELTFKTPYGLSMPAPIRTSWSNIKTQLLQIALTGYTVGANAVLAATDTILQAFGKLQAQINGYAASLVILHKPTLPLGHGIEMTNRLEDLNRETFARNSPFARGIPPNRKKTKNGNEISKTMAKSWIKSPNGC